MEQVVRKLLRNQDPNAKHSWLTRITISVIIVFANAVLYGFYGLVGSVVFYLGGVELAGLDLAWMFLPFYAMLGYSLWKSLRMIADYFSHYGHGR